jgi:hypothetical protein
MWHSRFIESATMGLRFARQVPTSSLDRPVQTHRGLRDQRSGRRARGAPGGRNEE